MSEQNAAFETTNTGYTQNLDYDNNGVPDWQQDLKVIHPDGYARDMNRDIIADPEPFVVAKDNISPGFSERNYRDNVANLTATFDPSPEHFVKDENRDSVSDANKLMRQAEHDLDKAGPATQIDPDSLLAQSLVRGAWSQRSAMSRSRARDGIYGSMRSQERDPSESNLDILMHAAKSFGKGWSAQRAKILTLEAQKMNQIDTILSHAMRHNGGAINDLYRGQIEKIYPGLTDKMIASGTMPVSNDELAKDGLAAPSTTGQLEREKTEGALNPPNAETDPAAKKDIPGQIEADKAAETPKAANDTADAGKEAGIAPKAAEVDEIARPFREPWPFNPRIIEEAANDPASVSRDDLIDAYASARGEQEMLRRLETRVRSAGSGIPEAKLAGMKLSEQKKAAGGLGLDPAGEARTRLNLRTDQLKLLSSEMKTRGIQTKSIDRECRLRARELPLAIPDIDAKPMLQQAIQVRKKLGMSRFEAENPINIEPKSVVRPFVPPRGPRVPAPGLAGVGGPIVTAIKAAQTVDQSINAATRKNEGPSR